MLKEVVSDTFNVSFENVSIYEGKPGKEKQNKICFIFQISNDFAIK